jgi:hypothetical protein
MVSQQLRLPETHVLPHILNLHNQGQLRLARATSPPPATLRRYLQTSHALWYWLTVGLAVAAAATGFLTPDDVFPWVYARHALGTILALWVPGYSFIKALFPSGPSTASETGLRTTERLVLGLGMSLALVPLTGLVLNYTPWGIHTASILISLLTAALLSATIAVVREYRAYRASAPAEETA